VVTLGKTIYMTIILIIRMTDKENSAASYVLNFYNEIIALNHNAALYRSLILEMQEKYKEISTDALTEQDKEQYLMLIRALRANIEKAYVHYTSIAAVGKLLENKEITKARNLINKAFAIDLTDLDKYCIAINQTLVTDFMQNLLVTSQAMVDNIYNDQPTNSSTA
jgi:hypothetical protein